MTILEMSLSASVLIMAVIVIRTLALHKLPKKTFLALWGIVLCRLLVPFSIPSQFSIYTLIEKIGNGIMGQSGTTAPNAGMFPTFITNAGTIQNTETISQVTSSIVNLSPLRLIWIVGCIACILFFVVTHLRCRQEYKTALPIQNNFVNKWQQEHSMKRPVQIRQSDKIAAPLTYGIWKPVILLPKTTDYADERRLQYILAHEYVHIKRFDTLSKWLLAATLCLHWFNPLVWVMYTLFNRDIELSCDETVVQAFGVTIKSAYALTLIGLAEKKSKFTPLCNNFSKNSIEERITAIMKIKKTSLVGIVLALTLILGTTTVFATSALAGNSNSTDNSSPESVMDKYDEETGKKMISVDNGETWMTEEEFENAYPDPEVEAEWWSYDEYKTWLEQEKIALQDMIGEKGWNPTDGSYVWTQEMVDETISVYEEILEEIRNGTMVSKSISMTVNGEEFDGMMSYNPEDIGTIHEYEVGWTLDNGDTAHFGPYDTKEELLAEVEPYCEEQVSAGTMTQAEVNTLLNDINNLNNGN